MGPNRRELLLGAAASLSSLPAQALHRQASRTGSKRAVHLTVDTGRQRLPIPADFTGLGYEISSVAETGLLSGKNTRYINLVRTLGQNGVIRVGGNTSDDSLFAAKGQPISAPKGTVVDASNIEDLGAFIKKTGWRLIWGLNLGAQSESQMVAEAKAIASAAGDALLAFEIGNEPDLFGRKAAHRPESYGYENYLEEYRRYKAAIRRALPGVPFAGPDVASATGWVTRFATDEGHDLKLLTHHYYRECAGPGSTLDKLLHPDPKLAPELETLRAAAQASKVPFRICETNSFCGGGKPGISDTFGAALWVLDFMFLHAQAGCAGVNMETGVNQLGFISSYSPIATTADRKVEAKPEYYGMLAFAQAGKGSLVPVEMDRGELNVIAYAVVADRDSLSLTIINKDDAQDAEVRMAVPRQLGAAKVLWLRAASMLSKDGVTLGGAPVSDSGDWKPTSLQDIHSASGQSELTVPSGSAAIVRWM